MDIKEFFKLHSEAAIAFSGGVDSAVLLLLAEKYANRVKAYYVKTRFQPQFELDDAVKIAEQLCVDLEIINADILADGIVAENPQNRCYFCKKMIFGEIIRHTKADGFRAVLDGTNASDDIGDRPGFVALQELEVLSPLRLCGYTKEIIRSTAREYCLPVADKPSYACLATRIPTGVRITAELLEITEKAESALRGLGFKNFRIRYLGSAAKLELGGAEFEPFYRHREEIYRLLLPYYGNIYLDLKERENE